MKLGRLYGIGVGPGEPELMTVKGARLLGECRHVYAPIGRMASESLALSIARQFVNPQARVHEVVFPMSADEGVLRASWGAAADDICAVLRSGEDACFLTLGDPLLYSTYIYLLRELRARLPEAEVVTVPGVNAFSAAAALAGFPVGEGKVPATIVPAADDLGTLERALDGGGTVVLMKIGNRLGAILRMLDSRGLLEKSVLVSRAGLDGQRIVTDLRGLLNSGAESEYLAIILVHGGKGR